MAQRTRRKYVMSDAARKRANERSKAKHRCASKARETDDDIIRRMRILHRMLPTITRRQLAQRLHISPERCGELLNRAGISIKKPVTQRGGGESVENDIARASGKNVSECYEPDATDAETTT